MPRYAHDVEYAMRHRAVVDGTIDAWVLELTHVDAAAAADATAASTAAIL